jgi:H2-forming N5,N10-methylenetetrahydromethanopterin dehydrogenase-like enzyme
VGGLVPVLSVTGRQLYLDVSQQILKIPFPELIAETATMTSVDFALVKERVGRLMSLLNANHLRRSTTNFVCYDFLQ